MNILALLGILQGCYCAAVVEKRDSCFILCPVYYSPVCGTDGHTYTNRCYLNVASCKDSSVQLAYEGECQTISGRASICPAIGCFDIYDPVCGTDGKTYGNECTVKVQYCHGEVTVAHHGPC